MEDPNLVLTLSAKNDRTKEVFKDSHNINHYLPPSSQDDSTSHAAREGTVSTCVDNDETEREEYQPRLQLRFDLGPRDIQRGWVFGSNRRSCDIWIGRPGKKISGQHFSITLDREKGVVLQDKSKVGTIVSYDGQCVKQNRKLFTWIFFNGVEKIMIVIDSNNERNDPLIFGVKLASHDSCEAEFQAHTRSYLEKAQTAATAASGSVKNDSLDSSQALTPTHVPLYYKEKELGRGGFGIVYRARDVSTGSTYAVKDFLPSKLDAHADDWSREVNLLKDLSHNHVVQFVYMSKEVNPCLVMEYLQLGSLSNQHRIQAITQDENMQLLYQGLQALEYLHSEGVTHRDIKPDNILLYSRFPFSIKLADFGLAKNTSTLKTLCGTPCYAAPEIWTRSSYTNVVDIWSFGLVVYKFGYGLPKIQRNMISNSWHRRVRQAIEDQDSDDLRDFLASYMLVTDPKKRLSAHECLKRIIGLKGLPEQTHVTTTTEKLSSALVEGIWPNNLECTSALTPDHDTQDLRRTSFDNRKNKPLNSSRLTPTETDPEVPTVLLHSQRRKTRSSLGKRIPEVAEQHRRKKAMSTALDQDISFDASVLVQGIPKHPQTQPSSLALDKQRCIQHLSSGSPQASNNNYTADFTSGYIGRITEISRPNVDAQGAVDERGAEDDELEEHEGEEIEDKDEGDEEDVEEDDEEEEEEEREEDNKEVEEDEMDIGGREEKEKVEGGNAPQNLFASPQISQLTRVSPHLTPTTEESNYNPYPESNSWVLFNGMS